MLTWKVPQVLNVNQVPRVFQEESILHGYRHPHSSATDCLLSAFQMTNETLNIWTHFLPAWYFLWRLVALLCTRDAWSDGYAWPFLIYLGTCCLYPLTSSCAHTFSSMSARARHVGYFCDYGALALYSLGSGLAYSAYAFPEEWLDGTFHRFFALAAVINTIIATSLSCYSRFMEREQPSFGKGIRILAFAYPYLFDSLPLFYRLYVCEAKGCTESAIPLHRQHIALTCFTCFLFAARLPEKLAPGLFDYIGHSHQLFHICAVLGTHFQMEALGMDMRDRSKRLSASLPPTFFSQTVAFFVVSVAVNFLLLTVFSKTVPRFCKRSRNQD